MIDPSVVRVARHGWLPCIVFSAASAWALDATVPGVATTPAPTFRQLSVEWAITGDDDLDGEVSVRFRPVGASAWRPALPLRRVPAGSNLGFSWGNRHSGTLFGLQPDTVYEIELSLFDPDGGSGQRLVKAGTRRHPQPMAGAPLRPLTPATLMAVLAAAQPGDILLFAPGSYPGFNLQRDGTAGMPIVLRGQPGVIIEGELGLFFREHVHLERLTVNGRIRFNGSDHVVITGCTVHASAGAYNGDGIVSYLRAESAWIADNTVIGTNAWAEPAMGDNGDNRGEGIVVTGPGHVIEHNRVGGFRDNISLMEGGEAVDQYSIDILFNELSEALDDAVEADFCLHNCRVLGNRVSNAFVAFSSQPGLGGPTWFVRNAAYNVAHVAFKLHRGSEGDILLHNSVVKAGDGFGIYAGAPVRRLFARNNLFLGGPGVTLNGYSSGSGKVAQIADLVLVGSSLDHDAYGSTTEAFSGRLGPVTFDSLAQLQALSSEVHAVAIAADSFAQPLVFPGEPLVQSGPVDLRLAGGSPARDAGIALAGINDGFVGLGPDAGAYEADRPLPHYGPRPGGYDGLFADGFEG